MNSHASTIRMPSHQAAPKVGAAAGVSGFYLQDNRPGALNNIVQRVERSGRISDKCIQKKSKGEGVIQLMRPHMHDVGRHFQIKIGGPIFIGTYIGPDPEDDSLFKFSTRTRGRVTVHEDDILGYRPTVGGMHPPGQKRPPEENVRGRTNVFLSEADLSGAMARQRRDPSLVDRMVVTTFENQPDYPDYQQNARDLAALGVPILPNFDLSNPENAQRLSGLGDNSNIHFQMPRVPRSVKGYSTQKLVHDTLSLPQGMDRSDISVSITTPHPDAYNDEGVHNRFYGLESGKAVKDTDMEFNESADDSDLEEYGYTHKQSTVDKSAEVAKRRKKYKFVPKKTEHEDFHDKSGGGFDKGPPPLGGRMLRRDLEEVF